jgi:predicted nicotinamide N-methyase
MPDLKEVLRSDRSRQIKILELGSGCGIVGIAFAAWFPDCVVHLTDLAEAQDILSKNLDQATPAMKSSLHAHTLDWHGDPDPSRASLEQDLALVLVSDCTYNADSCPDLVRTLDRISCYSPQVKILVAMKRRHDSEDIFFSLMQEARLAILERTVISLPHEFSVADVVTPEIEIYLYGLADGE